MFFVDERFVPLKHEDNNFRCAMVACRYRQVTDIIDIVNYFSEKYSGSKVDLSILHTINNINGESYLLAAV